MLSEESVRAMAEFIYGPRRNPPVAKVGTCPICGGEPGACVKEAHGYKTKDSKGQFVERTTTDGAPPAPGLENAPAPQPIDPKSGQHKAYWVLSADEIAKGLVRPVRNAYKHDACGAVTTMGDKLALTYARDPKFYGSTFCVQCTGHYPVGEFTWESGEVVGS